MEYVAEDLRAEQRRVCLRCQEENSLVCCESECNLYRIMKQVSPPVACAYCDIAMTCKKRPKFKEE